MSLNIALVNAKSSYLDVTPGLPVIIRSRIFRIGMTVIRTGKFISKVFKGPEETGNFIGKMMFKSLIPNRLIRSNYHRVCKYSPTFKGLGATMRTWITKKKGRDIRRMRIMFHDANKAGKHLDIHIGKLSLVMRITGKEVEKKIKYNNKGYLTKSSKDALIKHIKEEIANNSRVPQNHDHTVSNALASWTYSPSNSSSNSYGAGKTRQMVAEEDVEIIGKVDKTVNFYIPMLNKKTQVYLYKIHDEDTPICIIGNRSMKDPKVDDRLHLKMENDIDKFKKKVDPSTATEKYDGAACHLVTTNSNSIPLRFFSPRIGKEGRIEYTNKLPEFQELKSNISFRGMGELRFYKNTSLGKKFLSSAETGGVLNSNKIRDKEIFPDIKLYRIDKYNGYRQINAFWRNRAIQNTISKVLHKNIGIVSLTNIKPSKEKEGIVAVPKDKSVNDGYKIKWRADPIDMLVTSIDFYITKKNRVAGTVECEYNGKKYYFGPGQIGDRKLCEEFMKSNYVGRYVKTQGFLGGEARSSRILEVHTDK